MKPISAPTRPTPTVIHPRANVIRRVDVIGVGAAQQLIVVTLFPHLHHLIVIHAITEIGRRHLIALVRDLRVIGTRRTIM